MFTAVALLILAVFAFFVWRAARKSKPAATAGVVLGQPGGTGDFATTFPMDDGPGREQVKDTGGGPMPTKPK